MLQYKLLRFLGLICILQKYWQQKFKLKRQEEGICNYRHRKASPYSLKFGQQIWVALQIGKPKVSFCLTVSQYIVSWTFSLKKFVACVLEFQVGRPWELILQLTGSLQPAHLYRGTHTQEFCTTDCTKLCKFKMCPEICGHSKITSPVGFSGCIKRLFIHQMCKTFKQIRSLRFFSSQKCSLLCPNYYRILNITIFFTAAGGDI